MNAARDISPCQRFDRWVTAYVDGELDVVHALEVEDHLEACEICNEQVALLRATRCSLKRLMTGKCPGSLRKQISRVLVEARRAEGSSVSQHSVSQHSVSQHSVSQHSVPQHSVPQHNISQDNEEDRAGLEDTAGAIQENGPPSQAELTAAIVTNIEQRRAASEEQLRADSPLFKLRHIMPLAAAATVLLVFGVMRLQEQKTTDTVRQYEQNAVASLDGLLDEMVAQHANPPPPETTDPEGLAKFDPYLGLHVRKPELDTKQVRYLGARMMPSRHAMLQYILRDRHRLSLYMFDSKRTPLQANRLKPRHVGARNVYVGKMRGYSVAASERDGVGYVLASDLPDDESAKLVLTASR